MTEKSRTPENRMSRRQIAIGSAAMASLVPFAAVLSMKDASPEATPSASPKATSAPLTPTPMPVPDHAINIVRDRVQYGAPQTGGELRLYIQSGGLRDVNPALQSQDLTLLMSVFEGLVRINPETMEAEPGLAEIWSWSEDSLQLTFKLRKNVAWHDGTAFTAADAAFTCLMYRDDYDSTLAGLFGLIDTADAVNDSTLLLTFAAPDGAFVFNGGSMPMLSAKAYQTLWDEFVAGEKTISRADLTPANWIGTGPWRIDDVAEERATLIRFEDYWDTPAHCDRLVLLAEDDDEAKLNGWKAGEVDVLPISAMQMDGLWNEKGSLFVSQSSVALFAAFNFHNPINATSTMMVDEPLRAALNMSINRDAYADEVFFGSIDEHAVGTMAQPWLRDSSLRTPPYDPEAARKVLAEGGWSDANGDGVLEDQYGNTADLFLIVRNDECPELLTLLRHVQSDWSAIGVRLTIQPLQSEMFDDRWVQGRDYDLVAYSLVNYPAFNEFDLFGSAWDIRSNVQGWNPGGYFNADVDAAIQEWFTASDPDAMKAAATAIQHGTNDDLFGIWFGFPDDLVLVRPGLQGFNADMFLYSQNSHRWWKRENSAATPQATIVASPEATPGK